jgi:rhamnosyltransferase
MENGIAAIIVLYHPLPNIAACIQTYASDVQKIYLVDNSPEVSGPLLNELKKSSTVCYILMEGNQGIAAALNRAAEKAYADGFSYALTMDQDSSAGKGMVAALLRSQAKHPEAGIISPVHRVEHDAVVELHGDEEEVLTVMTSGNLLNLKIFKKMGGFLEKLFIDYVDHEYCLRLQRNGYSVIRANTASLYHHVGNLEERKFLYGTARPTHHSPERWYYQTRNRFYLRREYKKYYPEFFRRDMRSYWLRVVKMLLYEHQRMKKIRMILRGFSALRKNDVFRENIECAEMSHK